MRLRYTYELLEAYGALGQANVQVVPPRQATEEEILSYHRPEYLRAVQSLSRGEATYDPRAFNFGPGDNPIYPGLYEAALWSTGASLRAAELLIEGQVDVAFSIAGGLHHAMQGYASGFCVFNDPVIAINSLLARGLRVAYVDIDCHHGDGVQCAFYDTDAVLTVSLHESGAFLFPGTGFTQEIGAGRGKGYSVNVPLYPYTTDETFLWALREVVPPLIEAFRPDVLVTQLGIDTHYRDPITHMALTVEGFAQAVAELAKLVPDPVPKWLALGGGGYDLQAVARGWSMAFAVMSGQDLEDRIPQAYRERYGVESLRDGGRPQINGAILKDGRIFAENSVLAVHRLIFPIHGLRPG